MGRWSHTPVPPFQKSSSSSDHRPHPRSQGHCSHLPPLLKFLVNQRWWPNHVPSQGTPQRSPLQQIIPDGYLTIDGYKIYMEVFIGGDLPWLRLILGITTAHQVPSIYTKATLRDKEWVGIGSIRTKVTYAQHSGLLPVCAAGKGVTDPPLLIPPRSNVVLCILHLWMAFGRLLAHFIVTGMQTLDIERYKLVQKILSVAQTGVSENCYRIIDGENARRLFAAWEYLASPSPSPAIHTPIHATYR